MRSSIWSIGGALGAALCLSVAHAQAPAKTGVSPLDEKFMWNAAGDGMAEVKLGRLAAEKATREEVRAFAKMMVDEHSRANRELEDLATRKMVTLPAFLKKEHQALHDKLSGATGAAFDDAYMAAMVKDHTKAVADFTRVSKSGKDPDLKTWATATLPTLEKHLTEAKALAPKPRTGATTKPPKDKPAPAASPSPTPE